MLVLMKFSWLIPFVLGGLCGLFMRPLVAGIFAAGVFALCVAGFVASGIWDDYPYNWTWFFGIALMVVPVLCGMFFSGAVLSHVAVRAARRKRQSAEDGT
jgi:hypothetical protein